MLLDPDALQQRDVDIEVGRGPEEVARRVAQAAAGRDGELRPIRLIEEPDQAGRSVEVSVPQIPGAAAARRGVCTTVLSVFDPEKTVNAWPLIQRASPDTSQPPMTRCTKAP